MACQRMFSPFSTSHCTGAGALVSRPLACGPRNCGQLVAERLAVKSKASGNKVAFMFW